MFEQELDCLLQKKWSDEEKILITRLMDNVAYYKKLIPKSLKQDIVNALQMCNVLKTELETYREKCKCVKKCCECETCNCETCDCKQIENKCNSKE